MILRLKERFRLDKVVSQDNNKLIMQYVKIEDDRAIATDGYILANVPIENSSKKRKTQLLLHPAVWLRAVKKKRKDGYVVDAKEDEMSGKGSPVPDDYFPDWKKVVPDGKNHSFKIGLQAKYLYDLSQALGGDDRIVLSIDPDNRRAAIMVKSFRDYFSDGDENTALGLIMPIRLEGDE